MSKTDSGRVSAGKSLWTLVKVQLLTSFGINGLIHEKDKKRRGRYIARFFVLLLLTCMVLGYSYLIGFGMNLMGMTEVIPTMAFTVCCLMSVFFTMLKSVVTLFGFKDYDQLMCLPINNKVVITSKFIYMYITNELLTLGIMLPMEVAYSQRAEFYLINKLIWLLGIIVAPLIPMTFATILGAIVAAITSRVKHKNLISVILSFAMIYGIMMFNISINSSDENGAAFITTVKEISALLVTKMNHLYPPVYLFQTSLEQHNILPLLLLILISIAWYLLFVNVVAVGFNRINSRLQAHQAKRSYKMQELQTSSPVMALCKKEAARFLSSPGYIVNCMVGSLMAILFALFCVIKGPEEVIQTFAEGSFTGFTEGIICAIPFFASALLSMTCTSSVSLSLEGKNLWIVKSLPLEPRTILQSKILFDLFLGVSTSLLCGILLLIAFKPTSFVVAIWYLLTPVSFSILSSVWGMFMNVKFPNYEWENEMVIIKQSGSSAFSIFGGMLLGGIVGVIVVLAGLIGMAIPAAAVMTVLILLAAAGVYHSLMKVQKI